MLHNGDALAVLASLPGDSVDAICTDPPAGISFMGHQWDHDHGGREGWVRAFATIFAECRRVLRPGGHAFVWALPRTSHWTATALEDAGFEIRDICVHLFGSGFPKSLDVGKAIDKAAGAVREVVGTDDSPRQRSRTVRDLAIGPGGLYRWGDEHLVWNDLPEHAQAYFIRKADERKIITAPATPEAVRWNGWGTALKPAYEHWILCRKPLSEPTVAANVLTHGIGGLNVDGCRIESGERPNILKTPKNGNYSGVFARGSKADGTTTAGRWPANVALSHNDDCEQVGVRQVKPSNGSGVASPRSRCIGGGLIFGNGQADKTNGYSAGYTAPDGTETVPAWHCTEGCAVAMLDAQSGERPGASSNGKRVEYDNRSAYGKGWGQMEQVPGHGDTGGASRFFYTAKASTRERNLGLPAGMVNSHPTVKSIALMRWLCRLITPPGGTVLDCFMGSGTTGCAATLEGFNFIGIEQDAHYVDIAQRRIAYWAAQGRQVDMFAELPA
jgi:site-specific DNA-methyltransferase (adenine-specific)